MTTTAHEDQFTVAPEPVRQQYSTADILRRNVANLEVALRKQTERAENAEAELLAVREDNHSMMLEIDGLRKELAKVREQEPVAYVKYKATGGNVGLSWFAIPTQVYYPREGEPLYVNPIPIPAPAVPDDIHELAYELGGTDSGEYHLEPEALDKIIAAVQVMAAVPAPAVPAPVQTAKQADCRTCANSGKVNGLSQETYCESCVHEGRNWRKNNFLDAAGQRLLEGGK